MDLLTACRDPNLFAPWFKDPATWAAWRGFIAAAFGLPMAEEELAYYTRCTGRLRPPQLAAEECWLVCGRRSGKSFILSLIAVYLATFRDGTPYLAPGERATVMVIAADRRQARTIMRYVTALIEEVPLLRPLIEAQRTRADDLAFDLSGRVTIEVHAASYRSVRGYSIAAVLADEIGFGAARTARTRPRRLSRRFGRRWRRPRARCCWRRPRLMRAAGCFLGTAVGVARAFAGKRAVIWAVASSARPVPEHSRQQ